MPLNLSDLQTHEAGLLRQKDHIEKELTAIRYLIEGIEQRSTTISKIKEKKKPGPKVKPDSLTFVVTKALEEYNGHEFETATIADYLIQKGIRGHEEHERLRNTAYNILREWVRIGRALRENRGTDKNPKWVYAKIRNMKFGKN